MSRIKASAWQIVCCGRISTRGLPLSEPHPTAALVLVDDDPALLHALKFAFETEGYEVRAFADAESALAADGPHESLCLVLDQRLPGMSGLALLAALREQNVAAPAILITSNPPPAVRREARAAGVEIVEKPLLGDILATKVREVIEGADSV